MRHRNLRREAPGGGESVDLAVTAKIAIAKLRTREPDNGQVLSDGRCNVKGGE